MVLGARQSPTDVIETIPAAPIGSAKPSNDCANSSFGNREGTVRIAAAGSDVFVVSDEHRAAVLEGLGQAERGEFVSDEDMAGLSKTCGL